MLNLFTKEQLTELNEAVCNLLETEGMRVHYAPLRDLLRQYGAGVNDEKMTVCFSREMINALKQKQQDYAKNSTIFENTTNAYSPIVNDSIPFIYDLTTGKKRYATYEDAIESIKVQHMIPEIKSVRVPTMISDVPQVIEPLFRYRAVFDITDKMTAPVGFWDDRLIPYFKEMDIINGVKEPSFFSANMVISPMIIDESTGRKIIATAKEGYINRGATPMSTAGGTSAVTVEGTALMAATEILGMALVLDIVNTHFGIDNPNKITGFCVTGVVDMRTLQGVFSSPEAILQDIMVHDMFKDIYSAKIRFNPDYTDAKLPGMQCVLERVMKYSACAYAGSTEYIEGYSIGNLLTCTVHSTTQMIIDLEIGRALYKFFCRKQSVPMKKLLAETKEILQTGGHSFMMTDSTLDNYMDNFYSFIADRSAWSDADILQAENNIIKEANIRYKKLLDSYVAPKLDATKLKALDKVIDRAKVELM